ncbi:hypothetical protein [Vitiosangium sp. GDMCC 1.1324]|uniref:hypothetical protein n=1 Tax=Vitiosangium sp. (strain GDMCC 1.1324) TaxID=2138576 RepID=UPI000D3569D5|nr:hypothetical protein [Vitiosangium sp. GDMCC 1.1324]PTL80549.1 hypothetical protein DAT35_28380 [Vitiosangium sp. GDMCC 1.1324]
MRCRLSLALLSLTLAACTTPQHNTREVIHRTDSRFFLRELCQPKSTAPLPREQVTGLEELPAALRDRVLADLPVEAVGSRPFMQCQDVAARLLEDRLHALCWPEALVTHQNGTGTAGAPAAQPRLNVQLGARYQVDTIWVVQGKNATVPPARITHAAKSALPKDKACTARTLEDIQASVSRLGTFQRVLVVPGPPDSEKKTVPVVVDISETAPATQKTQATPKTQEPGRNSK